MATIRKSLDLAAPADRVWDALADFGAVHRRIAPGFLTDCRLDGESRVVTFASGQVFREHLVSADPAERRLVYAIAEPPFLTYQGTVEVTPQGEGRCRFAWTVDLLPNELAGHIEAQMELGAQAIRRTLEAPVSA
ncbi:SRPBCC family protein [Phenylobacterium terrae]|uniref:SRPBCC family protein n=1 Tax=Phenylobacterium terrae TaxID=2665495 RepID=A0ABW4N627_9CAUL